MAALEDDSGVEGLRRYFAGRLPDRLTEVEEAGAAARETGWAAEPLRRFHRLTHSLVGAGATFGFPAITEHARALEHLLKAHLDGGPPPTDAEVAEVAEILDRLRAAAQ